ncbi:MAG: excinuclease ABC subunit UvrA [Clostridia bacterium]|nr:excinuclease ABC subunit UvrA [Clostridia bacterium]
MKENIEENIFEINPVGRLIMSENHTYAVVYEKYRPALKHLELFSHALVFFETNGNRVPTDTPKELQEILSTSKKLLGSWNENRISIFVSRVIRVNENTGIIELDYANSYDGAKILDIKPYFPCEDRVYRAVTGNSMGKWPEWRLDKSVHPLPLENAIAIPYETEGTSSMQIRQLGTIRKQEGACYLELNDPDGQTLEVLSQFSHMRILWWFHRFDNRTYRRVTQGEPPYEDAPRTGVFASRSPVRPNPIALTTARVLELDQRRRVIRLSDLDSFDKTPVIGIKPYIPALDRVREFYVPQWVRHWPEWLDDREANHSIDHITMIESDVDQIKKYMKDCETEEGRSLQIGDESKVAAENNSNYITIKGAKQNNLKNVDTIIPKNKITVITGVSGSGKSSLAFDTLYAESQRRFMDSMSTTGRMAFEQLGKPEVEQISGLPPAIAIEQKTISRNPRSTVGTITDIYDYLRLLFSRIGTRHCPDCGRALRPLSKEEIAAALTELKPETRFDIRAFNSDTPIGIFTTPGISVPNKEKSKFSHSVKEAVQQGLELGNGAILVTIEGKEAFLLQTRDLCYHCSRIFFELTASTFSFNNPEGMCPDCNGIGLKLSIDPELIISNPERSILDEASPWWGNLRKHRQKPNANWMRGEVLALAEEMKVDLELPWNQLPEDFRQQALYGSNGRELCFEYENTNGRRGEIVRPAEGAYNHISRLFKENNGGTAERIVSAFMREKECPTCKGERLAAEGRLVTIGNTRFPETVGMTIEDLKKWITDLPSKLTNQQYQIAAQVLSELNKRLQALTDVGVQYLTLNRAAPTLSGGEAQRLRLATQLGCGLTNLLYILDEPSIGLHPRDHYQLVETMKGLRDAGNTVVVVEHDADTMLAADRIIDVGPGAGEYGGSIIAEGTPEEVMDNPVSDTGKYLRGVKKVGNPERMPRKPEKWIKLRGARLNNLKNIDVDFPLGVFTCVTGVSGSGKSSLVSKTLYPAMARHLNLSEDAPGPFDYIEGIEMIDKVINITQMPIGRTPRSNPATYTGVFDDIRDVFAATEEAKKRKYKQNRFSFNSKEGRCEACGGEGRKCIEMHFMPDVWVECSQCHGKRFNPEALEIRVEGRTIADVLEMDVKEALEFFQGNSKIEKVLQTLHDVGLDYIRLGQSALTLSGGEAQRIKLAKELSRDDTGRTLYILDEPTTGLHFEDVQNLLKVIHRITDAGNTVIVIEHNSDMISNADWIIDIGPEGGCQGGYVVAQGTPKEVAACEQGYTGKYLRKHL